MKKTFGIASASSRFPAMRRARPLLFVLVLVALNASRGGAQDSLRAVARDSLPAGRIVGRIIDASSGAGISDAYIQVVGAELGTQSGVDGRFTIGAAPAGTITLHIRRIGYAAKTVTGILLNPGQSIEQ